MLLVRVRPAEAHGASSPLLSAEAQGRAGKATRQASPARSF